MSGLALVRPPGPLLAGGIVTHLDRKPVDAELALDQHAQYVAALSTHGWRAVEVPRADEYPDAVFVEDTVLLVDDVAILTRPGAEARRGETAGTESALSSLTARGRGVGVLRIEAPATLDGGDVLQVGHTVYVGRGGRTNAEAIRQLRALLAPLERTVVPVQLKGVLHLKSAVTALPDRTLIGLPDLIDTAPLPTLRVPPEEAGAHVVPLGGSTVLLAASAPRTADWLGDLGFAVVTVDIGEFEKLEGCVTCLSVLVPD